MFTAILPHCYSLYLLHNVFTISPLPLLQDRRSLGLAIVIPAILSPQVQQGCGSERHAAGENSLPRVKLQKIPLESVRDCQKLTLPYHGEGRLSQVTVSC